MWNQFKVVQFKVKQWRHYLVSIGNFEQMRHHALTCIMLAFVGRIVIMDFMEKANKIMEKFITKARNIISLYGKNLLL